MSPIQKKTKRCVFFEKLTKIKISFEIVPPNTPDILIQNQSYFNLIQFPYQIIPNTLP